jgi:predicted nucleic acid-binding protein
MTTEQPLFMLDSNILVYSIDPSEHEKQLRSLDVLHKLAESERGIVSIQVLGEFFRSSTRQIRQLLSHSDAETQMHNFAAALHVLETTLLAVLEGARGVRLFQLSYWDAVIWATAKFNGIPYLLSEDMGDGRLIEGVRILNPLRPDFDMSLLS